MRIAPAVSHALKRAAVAVDRVVPPPRGITVLIYHRIGGRSSSQIDLPTAAFDEQMAAVAEAGAITLDEAVSTLTSPASSVGSPDTDASATVVTFDDGTADFVEDAVPVLVKHGVPAYLYIATNFVETGTMFPADGVPLSWNALRDCLSTGLVAVGSHTHRHLLLDRLPRVDVETELDRSRELIEDRLGIPAEHFAYPKAVLGSPAAEGAVRERFKSAAIAGTRANVPGRANVYRLHRTPVQVADRDYFFERKLHGGMRLEDAVRRAVNRRRYAGATT